MNSAACLAGAATREVSDGHRHARSALRDDGQLWVPPGFAHGYMVLSEAADFLYKTTDYCAPQHERCLLWNDPAVGVEWPLGGCAPTLSEKDRVGVLLAQAECYE